MPRKKRNKAGLESQADRVQEVVPVSESKPYSSVSVNGVEIETLAASRPGQKCVVGVDVAKLDFKAVLCWPDGSFQRPWRIKVGGAGMRQVRQRQCPRRTRAFGNKW